MEKENIKFLNYFNLLKLKSVRKAQNEEMLTTISRIKIPDTSDFENRKE